MASCGTPDPQSISPLSVEAFTLPDDPAFGAPDASERLYMAFILPCDSSLLPDTPPPRNA
jgi:hypothetical protein